MTCVSVRPGGPKKSCNFFTTIDACCDFEYQPQFTAPAVTALHISTTNPRSKDSAPTRSVRPASPIIMFLTDGQQSEGIKVPFFSF